ncbi:ROK family glucokinase [Cellulomonas fimi]|uniref:Glucokinase n=1 Tax=Cellulomonas fimi (strain ATCC 484 / DSM 20113 / JCM 1341 / CCUG 24087 / LMG 16345 / NBRC 15513 / NCIMB 8980 / NCTC 7547 / NRS-133) TaxID=590998 RepID=F4H1K3_CELFA|nr:ROK family glucokinase [Cellulomonas fimi]AEE46302.1 glucokinase, ROK family [Cellulomonas fimi ATCC 484]NNH06240.1 ROK family glucokinase [Cellulomonas fimi]VEH32443.1 Glucokinase [Cellulomonas fimi]
MHAIGVDIGGTKIAAGVVDEDGVILAQTRVETSPDDVAGIDRAIAQVYTELAGSYEVGAMGLAAAGFVAADRSGVLFAPNIAWRDYPLRDRVKALIADDITVVVENDANAAGWAEFRFGAARDVDDMLMLTVGTGLGGAIVSNGELVRGAWGVASEVGHMRVVPGGHYCGCGHEGCWEQYASGSALVRDAQAAAITQPERALRLLELAGDVEKIVGPQITQAAEEGDPLAVELLAELGRWLGEGAASATALLDPALIVVGGGVVAAGELLLGPARKGFAEQLSARGHRPEAVFVAAAMGNDAGMVGAADLARI